LWQCQIITRRGVRTEIIGGDENLSKYVDTELLQSGEIGIVIQRQIEEKTPHPRNRSLGVINGKSSSFEIVNLPKKKPWWKFW
jgi:hypothetical protein